MKLLRRMCIYGTFFCATLFQVLAFFVMAPATSLAVEPTCLGASERIGDRPPVDALTLLKNINKLRLFWLDQLERHKQKGKLALGFLAEVSLRSLGRAVPEVDDLLKIFVASEAKDGEALKTAITNWVTQNHIAIKLVWPEDLKSVEADFRAQGLLSVNDDLVLSNGYINNFFYSLMAERGMFPIADPHDILSHLPLFIFPEVVESFKAASRLNSHILELDRESSGGGVPDVEKTRLRRAMDVISEVQDGDFRFLSFESINFLEGSKENPYFVFGGNHAIWLSSKMENWPADVTVDYLADMIFIEEASSQKSLFPQSLPLRAEYLSEFPERWTEIRGIAEKMGMNANGNFDGVRAVLRITIKEVMNDLKQRDHIVDWNSPSFRIHFFSALALKVSKEPYLAKAFEFKPRLELQRALPRFYIQYLDWLKAKRGNIP